MLQVVSIKIFLMNFDFLFSRCHFRNPGHNYYKKYHEVPRHVLQKPYIWMTLSSWLKTSIRTGFHLNWYMCKTSSIMLVFLRFVFQFRGSLQAYLHHEPCTTPFLRPREDLRRVGETFCEGLLHFQWYTPYRPMPTPIPQGWLRAYSRAKEGSYRSANNEDVLALFGNVQRKMFSPWAPVCNLYSQKFRPSCLGLLYTISRCNQASWR